MLTIFALRRFAFRRRRAVAALCAVLAIGVVTHHSMPGAMAPLQKMGHSADDHAAMVKMVVCLAVAGLASLLVLAARPKWRIAKRPLAASRALRQGVLACSVLPRSRAGPLTSVVLRL